ncbi:hypothetical protein BKA80DRAFT_258035 [Phyllosticta citrichinensis]
MLDLSGILTPTELLHSLSIVTIVSQPALCCLEALAESVVDSTGNSFTRRFESRDAFVIEIKKSFHHTSLNLTSSCSLRFGIFGGTMDQLDVTTSAWSRGSSWVTTQPRNLNSSRSRKTTRSVPREPPSSYLEKLPAEVVCRIGGKLQRRDLKSLSVSSKTLCNHLEKTFQPQSTTIEGPLTWKKARLLVNLIKIRFAKSVEYLHFNKFPANSWQRDLKRHRNNKRPGEEDDCLVLGLMLAQALKGFENLEWITLDFRGTKRTVKDDLTARSLPFYYALQRIESSVEFRVLYVWGGCFDLIWSVTSTNDDGIYIKNCRPETVPFWIDGHNLTGRDPKFLSVSDVRLRQPPEYFSDCLEELEFLNISEMESAGAGFPHYFHQIVVQGENLQSLRKLSIFTAEQSATWIPMLKRLLEASQLERLEFELNGGVRFDWDGDRKLDGGSKNPEMVEDIGMKPTLEKMISAYRNIYA